MTTNTQYGKLSAIQVKQAKTKAKTYKLSDGKGLNLEVKPNGSKYWRLAYRYQQKQKTLAIGVYPDTTLAIARKEALEARQLLRADIDPAVDKRQRKREKLNNTVERVAKEWHKKQSGEWSTAHAKKIWHSVKTDILPILGDRPILDVKTRDVLFVIKKVEERGALDMAARVKQRISAIFRYAIQTGLAEYNPVDALTGVLKTKRVVHRKAIDFNELPKFLKAIDSYNGYVLTRLALKFIVYTFVRPGELRSAEWRDIDLTNAIWRIPAEKMKMNEEHIVPLSEQAIKLLVAAEKITGNHSIVFSSVYDFKKPMSENTMTFAIRKRLGFDATAHGFRATASTILNETGYRVDVIERQLAHGEQNKIRAAYNRSQYIAERTEMMQWYGDYLDNLKTGAKIVPINKTRAKK